MESRLEKKSFEKLNILKAMIKRLTVKIPTKVGET